ncbi:hypothetical protein ABIF66_001567 [Bradyrhizobium japonicum]
MFDRGGAYIDAAIESLVTKDARNALGMFAHIIASLRIRTSQTSSTVIAGPVSRIPEDQIILLMRRRFPDVSQARPA